MEYILTVKETRSFVTSRSVASLSVRCHTFREASERYLHHVEAHRLSEATAPTGMLSRGDHHVAHVNFHGRVVPGYLGSGEQAYYDPKRDAALYPQTLHADLQALASPSLSAVERGQRVEALGQRVGHLVNALATAVLHGGLADSVRSEAERALTLAEPADLLMHGQRLSTCLRVCEGVPTEQLVDVSLAQIGAAVGVALDRWEWEGDGARESDDLAEAMRNLQSIAKPILPADVLPSGMTP